jgi:hypothetical protein
MQPFACLGVLHVVLAVLVQAWGDLEAMGKQQCVASCIAARRRAAAGRRLDRAGDHALPGLAA